MSVDVCPQCENSCGKVVWLAKRPEFLEFPGSPLPNSYCLEPQDDGYALYSH